MLRYSVIHPMPNGDIFQFSSHHDMTAAELKITRIKAEYRKHPERFNTWFNPLYLGIRDNFRNKRRIP